MEKLRTISRLYIIINNVSESKQHRYCQKQGARNYLASSLHLVGHVDIQTMISYRLRASITTRGECQLKYKNKYITVDSRDSRFNDVVNKLVIEVEYQLSDKEFVELLGTWEFPRGTTTNILFFVTNISEEEFRGGVLREITVSINESIGVGIQFQLKPHVNIPSIGPDEKTRIFEYKVPMSSEGQGWIKCKIDSNDKQPIEYFQAKGGISGGTEEWLRPFVVVNKEQLEIINLLKDIREKIH